jgi:hypothetical protein
MKHSKLPSEVRIQVSGQLEKVENWVKVNDIRGWDYLSLNEQSNIAQIILGIDEEQKDYE